MPISTPASLIDIAKYCATALLVLATATSLAASQAERLQLGYLAVFPNGSLKASLDRFDFGSLQEGHSQIPDTHPNWTPDGGDLVLQVKRPATPITGAVSIGVFATPLSFGPGALFKASATFVKPIGPHGINDVWAIGVGARTGGNDDLPNATRIVVTLQVRGTSLRLNAVGSGVPGPELPPEVYDEIFSPTDPQPFTLELLVDRISGVGAVNLKVGDREFPRAVSFPPFPASSGPVITAIGPSVAIGSASGQTASVHLREFRIFAPLSVSANDAATCPKTWDGFGCRMAPNTD